MNIGATIKKLRRERDITQEQLAEYLNISVSAVSQWESNKTSPDISTLPLLANIFEVSADVILGIDVDMKEKRIEEIYNSAYNQSIDGYRDKACEILKNGFAEFPNSYRLMAAYASELYCRGGGGLSQQEKESRLNEIASLCQKILDGCTDNGIRNGILFVVCNVYKKIGKREEAIAIAKSIPVYNMARNELLKAIYEGDELFEQFRTNIIASNCVLVCNMLDLVELKRNDGTPYYTDDEILIICEKAVKIMEAVFEDRNYFYYSQYIGTAHVLMLKIYADRMDTDNALTQLEYTANSAIMFDTYGNKEMYTYTSILFRGMEGGGYYKNSPDFTQSKELLESMLNSRYDFIRNHPRFIAVEEELKNI